MNKKIISREGWKSIHHTSGGGSPGSQQPFIQQLIGQFDRFHPAFMPQSMTQTGNARSSAEI
jgi:hypothetical protein